MAVFYIGTFTLILFFIFETSMKLQQKLHHLQIFETL